MHGFIFQVYGQNDHLDLNRQTFEWSANPLCRLFRDYTTAREFVLKFTEVLNQLEEGQLILDTPDTTEPLPAKRVHLSDTPEEPVVATSSPSTGNGDLDTSWIPLTMRLSNTKR